MPSLSRSGVVPRLLAGLVIVLWFVVAAVGGPLVGQLSSVQDNDQASFLPQEAESTRVAEQLPDFEADATLPLIVAVESGEGLDRQQLGSSALGRRNCRVSSSTQRRARCRTTLRRNGSR